MIGEQYWRILELLPKQRGRKDREFDGAQRACLYMQERVLMTGAARKVRQMAHHLRAV
jgi:hypothetical protein